MSIWRRLLGLPDPARRLMPPLGQLHVFDDDNTLHAYEITCADFNIYQDCGHHWLTVYAAANVKIQPDDDENPEPFIELNLPFQHDPEPIISAMPTIKVVGYHKEFSNLASMYNWWTHSPFDGSLHVEEFSEVALTARVEGKSNEDPVALHARFQRNHDRQRGFT